MLIVLLMLWSDPSVTVVRCSTTGNEQGRVYELQRSGEGDRARWAIVMRTREAGTNPVVLPLPDAKPVQADRRVSLTYRTLNGGRVVTLNVDETGRATLDVYANFELEVNVDANLDPRVELMNTNGPTSALSCTIAEPPG